MSYDQSPSGRHNLDSLLSPHSTSSKSGVDKNAAQTNESHYTQQQQQQQHSASHHASDNAYRQSAPYQSPTQQQLRQKNEYSQRDLAYGQSQRDINTAISDYPESVYDQYTYPDAQAQKYSQTPVQPHYDERAPAPGHPEYSDYRDAYGRPEYGYTDAAAHVQHNYQQQHRGPVYEYDYEQHRHDRSAYAGSHGQQQQQQQQQPYMYESQRRHPSDEYYSRSYEYADSRTAYGQEPTSVEPVVDHGRAEQQPPPSSTVYYDDLSRYDYRSYAGAREPRTYEQVGHALDLDYASGQQPYRYSTTGQPIYSPHKNSPAPAAYPAEADYRPAAHGSSSQMYQRESPVYGSTSRYSADPYVSALEVLLLVR
ncbi:hypothetical protein GGI23_000143 [Coemansia sp. RSA 2559]|nr:hypothetical protein GGI23_000143 [Coemansia sp. RSA 2559]KAJ2869738.1 hypothetical protein GGI22_000079 [Coemansia erecta]